MHPPVLDMFAGVGDPILPADHMVNRPKLAATHLALNFTISPGISSSPHPEYSETPTIYGYYLKSLVLKNLWQWPVAIFIVQDGR